jgi:TatD DNase family protein
LQTQQYEAFETQIRWALQYDLPVAIHSRNALDECIDVVSLSGTRGVFHCFSGTVEQARRIMEQASLPGYWRRGNV